jgi:hypothetical protein
VDVYCSVHISVFVLREFTVREVEHEFEQSDDVARESIVVPARNCESNNARVFVL